MSADFGLPDPHPDPGATSGRGPGRRPGAPGGGSTRRRAAVVAGVATLLFVAGVVVGATTTRHADTRALPAGGTTAPSAPSAPPAPSGSASPGTPAPSPSPGGVATGAPPGGAPPAPPVPAVKPTPPPVTAVVPGWHAVVGRELVAYDVPPAWHVEEGSAITGFEFHDDADARLVTMHNLASYRTGACRRVPGSARARAGFVSPRGQAADRAAPELSQRWAEVAALQLGGRDADVSPTRTVTTRVGGGTVAATEATTLVRLRHPEPCQAPAMTVTAVSFEAHGAVVAFVLWTDEQVADAVDPSDPTRILRSLRPVP